MCAERTAPYTKHAAASCTSPPSPMSRPFLSPQYLGSAEPVSQCGQGRLHCRGCIGAAGQEAPAASPPTALQHRAKSPQLLAGWGSCLWEALPPCQAPQEHDQDRSSCVWRLQRYCAGEEESSFRVTRQTVVERKGEGFERKCGKHSFSYIAQTGG